MMQAIQSRDNLTNEYIMKKFTNQFALATVAMRKAVALIKAGVQENEDIINVAAEVLEEMGEEAQPKE